LSFDQIIEPWGDIPKAKPRTRDPEASGPIFCVAEFSTDSELQDALMNCDNRLIQEHAAKLIERRKTMPPKVIVDPSSEDTADEGIDSDLDE
jgi:hypothetical protein